MNQDKKTLTEEARHIASHPDTPLYHGKFLRRIADALEETERERDFWGRSATSGGQKFLDLQLQRDAYREALQEIAQGVYDDPNETDDLKCRWCDARPFEPHKTVGWGRDEMCPSGIAQATLDRFP